MHPPALKAWVATVRAFLTVGSRVVSKPTVNPRCELTVATPACRTIKRVILCGQLSGKCREMARKTRRYVANHEFSTASLTPLLQGEDTCG